MLEGLGMSFAGREYTRRRLTGGRHSPMLNGALLGLPVTLVSLMRLHQARDEQG